MKNAGMLTLCNFVPFVSRLPGREITKDCAAPAVHRKGWSLLAAITIIFVATAAFARGDPSENTRGESVRQHVLMNAGWRFALGNACDPSQDFGAGTSYFSCFAKAGYGDGPASPSFDDRAWRVLDLPHDWAVELPFDSTASPSHGYKPLGRKFPGTSIGWYRKSFFIPKSDLGKRIALQFDGVFRNSEVWVNGFYLGQEKSGYSSFEYDVTDYLNYGSENVVAVRVDASMEEGWFYEGAGIYRDVWLNVTSPLHIAPWGTFVSSEVDNDSAKVEAGAEIANDGRVWTDFNITQTIHDENGNKIARGELHHLTLGAASSGYFLIDLFVDNPKLWSPDTPYLYSLVTEIYSGDSLVDDYETRFGLRTIRFDADSGFYLNGKHVVLKGTNNHQDFAGVGTAVPDPLHVFRVEQLKAMGSNAIRCSHNPPAPAFLDVCDSLGMLVIDENRPMGTSPEQLNQLKQMIVRDRNHPSIILWSLGNEEWAIEGNVKGARIAADMQDFAHRVDPTRPTTAACSGWGQGISTVVQIMGYNYIFNGDIDRHHAEFPGQPSVGTEETTSQGTRGIYTTNRAKGHLMQIDREPGVKGLEYGMKFYAERPFLSGLFYWTGFDYRGEPNPFGWPQVATQYGILDLCGFPKDMFYYVQSEWTNKPVIHILPHWNWPGREGEVIDVWAYSNCDSVEILLNGKSLGREPVPAYSHAEWKVRYEPGTLLAKGFRNGKQIVTDKVETTNKPAALKLVPDLHEILSSGSGVAVVTVMVKDSKGRTVPTAGNEIVFTLKGPAKIIGVGNGDPSSHAPEQYLEDVRAVKIDGLRMKRVSSTERLQEIEPVFDDSDWEAAFTNRDRENRVVQDTSKLVVIRGTFELSGLLPETAVTLLTKSIEQVQDIYVNGHLIAKDVKRDATGQTYPLDRSLIHEGKNVYAVVGPPLIKRNIWEILNTDPGLVRVINPAHEWRRKAFNGVAQVIVRSEKGPGNIELTAASPGLKESTLVIKSIRPE